MAGKGGGGTPQRLIGCKELASSGLSQSLRALEGWRQRCTVAGTRVNTERVLVGERRAALILHHGSPVAIIDGHRSVGEQAGRETGEAVALGNLRADLLEEVWTGAALGDKGSLEEGVVEAP